MQVFKPNSIAFVLLSHNVSQAPVQGITVQLGLPAEFEPVGATQSNYTYSLEPSQGCRHVVEYTCRQFHAGLSLQGKINVAGRQNLFRCVTQKVCAGWARVLSWMNNMPLLQSAPPTTTRAHTKPCDFSATCAWRIFILCFLACTMLGCSVAIMAGDVLRPWQIDTESFGGCWQQLEEFNAERTQQVTGTKFRIVDDFAQTIASSMHIHLVQVGS